MYLKKIFFYIFTLSEILFWDFPGDPAVKNPHANAGNTGSVPGQGIKISYTSGQLSLSALEPMLCNKRSYHSEKPDRHN